MKILMLLEHEFPGDNRVEKEVQSLYQAGHDIVVASTSMSYSNSTINTNNCKIYRRHIPKFYWKSSVAALKSPFYFNFWRSFVDEIISIEKIQAIHVHDLPLAQVGYEMKKRFGCKLVIDLHENWPAFLEISKHTNTFLGKMLSSNNQWRNYERDMVEKADRVIAVVDEMRNRIEPFCSDKTKIIVLENTQILQPDNGLNAVPDPEFFTITYVGGITPARGLQYVIRGMAMVVKSFPKTRLWIIGDGNYAKHLKKLSVKNQLNDNITFFGKRNHEDTWEYLKKTNIAIIPHVRSEQTDNSSPNKLFEYMNAGVPVLVSNCTSIERIVNETQAGLIYIYNSPQDLAQKIIGLISAPEILSTMGANGRKAVLEKYNWRHSSQELIRMYSVFDQN